MFKIFLDPVVLLYSKIVILLYYYFTQAHCQCLYRVRLNEGFLVLMAVCSVRSNFVLYLAVVSIVVLSQAILCPVVREWWAGAD